jgi:hypothetical protein
MSFVAGEMPNAQIGSVPGPSPSDPSPLMAAAWPSWMNAVTARLEANVAKDLLGGVAGSALGQDRFGSQFGPPDPTSGSPSLDLEEGRHMGHEIIKPNGQ